jgi:putative ABC transport system ATP-binding protein
MLEMRNVTKSYGSQLVLSEVNFKVPEREMISIMGKSGVGKSTLLAIIAGLVRPDTGQVLFDGDVISDLEEEKLAAFRLYHVGFIFQDFKLIPSLSVHDNILLGIYPRQDITPLEKEKRISELTQQVGLSDKIRKIVDKLSGGEKQRVAIARSLVNRPDLVLADEPTGNLDQTTAEEIMLLFNHLQKKMDTTFLIITHDRDIAAHTRKIFTLKDGGLTYYAQH